MSNKNNEKAVIKLPNGKEGIIPILKSTLGPDVLDMRKLY